MFLKRIVVINEVQLNLIYDGFDNWFSVLFIYFHIHLMNININRTNMDISNIIVMYLFRIYPKDCHLIINMLRNCCT